MGLLCVAYVLLLFYSKSLVDSVSLISIIDRQDCVRNNHAKSLKEDLCASLVNIIKQKWHIYGLDWNRFVIVRPKTLTRSVATV